MPNPGNGSGRPAKPAAADAAPGRSEPRSESQQAAPKWLGKRVGRFKLQALIGQGAMGRVFRAEDSTLQRRVALKLISISDRNGQINPAANRFLTEARASASLEHPHIVQVYEAGESGNVCYIAMELLEGGSLRELVDASGPLDIHRACQLTAEAAEALQVAHSAGIIHRDVKPANLMLSRHGRCKVTDFGLARVDDNTIASPERDQRVGTPLFAAPEVIRGTSADERSDIYSLGATLFYLLTGRPPFLARSRADAMRAHLEQPVPDIRALRPDVPDGLAVAIEKSLDKDPGRRFASTEQFSRVLRVYTIPVAGVVPAVPAFVPVAPHGGSAGSSGGVAAPSGMSGSLGGSDMLSALGPLAASGSVNASGSWPGDRARTPTNRMASMESSSSSSSSLSSSSSHRPLTPGPPPPPPPSPMPSHMPVAAIVSQPRRIAGIPMAGWIGIAGGVVVVVGAVVWVMLNRPPTGNQTALSTPAPVPTPVLAAHQEPAPVVTPAVTPAPAPAPAPVPAAVVTPPVAKVDPPKPAPPSPAPAPKPVVASSGSNNDDLPAGVLRPRDLEALKKIANGDDPAHPDKHAVIQGTVLSAAESSTGKVFHIKFTGVGGTDPFDVAYFQSSGMFERMEQKFGKDLATALVGKDVRIAGRMRLFHDSPDSPEMILESPEDLKILEK